MHAKDNVRPAPTRREFYKCQLGGAVNRVVRISYVLDGFPADEFCRLLEGSVEVSSCSGLSVSPSSSVSLCFVCSEVLPSGVRARSPWLCLLSALTLFYDVPLSPWYISLCRLDRFYFSVVLSSSLRGFWFVCLFCHLHSVIESIQ